MPAPRHQIRKVQLQRPRYWEEQIAPAQVAWWLGSLYALGVSAHLLLRDGQFDAFQVRAFLTIGIALTLAGSVMLPLLMRRWLKRGFLVAMMTSLLLNTSVAWCLAYLVLQPPYQEEQAEAIKPPEPEEETTLAEYFPLAVDGNDRPELDLRRPVVTGEPDLEQEDWIRKTAIALPEYDEPRPDATPPTPERPLPTTMARREMADTVPRRFDAESTLSRQSAELLARLGHPEAPSALRLPPATESETDAQAAEAQPADTSVSVAKRAEIVPEAGTLAKATPSPEAVAAANDETEPIATAVASSAELERAMAQVEPLTAESAPPPAPRRADLALTERPANAALPVPSTQVDSPAKASSTRRSVPNETVAAQPVTTTLPRRALAPAPDPNELEAETPAPLRPRLPELTRATPSQQPPLDDPAALPLADREPFRAEVLAPTLVDVDNAATQGAELPSVAVTPRNTELPRSSAPLAVPVNLPAPAVTAAAPHPVLPSRGSESRADLVPGSAEVVSNPHVDVALELTGSNSPEMTSPLDRPTPQANSLRSLATVRPEQIASEVPVPQLGAASSALVAAANPAMTSLGDASSRQGMSELADTVTQPGQTQIEVGSPQPSESSQLRRSSGGGQPEVVQPLAEQATTIRRVGGDARPALPSVVAAPQVAAQAEQSGDPVVTAAASESGRATAANTAAALERAETLEQAGPPAGSTSAPDFRLVRASLTPVRPDPTVADGGAAPVARRQATSMPLETPHDALIVQGGLPHAAADSDPIAAEQIAPARPANATSYGTTSASALIMAGNDGEANSPEELPTTGSEPRPAAPVASLQRVEAVSHGGPQVVTRAPAQASAARESIAPAPRTRRAVELPSMAGTVGGSMARATDVAPATMPMAAGGRPNPSDLLRGGLAIAVDAPDGLGGLSSDISLDVGSLSRRAQRESDQVVDSAGRFLRHRVGGILSVKTNVVIPATAYQTRLNRLGEDPAGGNGRPSPKTEEAIELGLIYLASRQLPDGSWSLGSAGDIHDTEARRNNPDRLALQSDTGATGLCLLSFLGAGYHHRGDKHRDVVHAGLQYLIDNQKDNGDLYLPQDASSNRSAWLYSHAIASIALCEAYGMTQDPELLDAAQRAVDFIVAAQHRDRGAWRYQPGVGADTSVSGWMVMALRSAELANLNVPHKTWEDIEKWLDRAQASDTQPELYRYNPYAPNTREQGHGRRPSKTMTAVGLLMRMYTGWRREDGAMVAGAEYLKDNLPTLGTIRDPQRDTYYWYYATQVMFHMRGEYWDDWNRELHPLLTSTQLQTGALAGSWDPDAPLPDRWASQAGRLYVTTLNLLSLEVYYRHLPIYEDTAR